MFTGRCKEDDSGENVSEWHWTLDDSGEKITDEVDEAKCFKQVRVWDSVHMCQTSQEKTMSTMHGQGHWTHR